jgi:hypothetical protein
MAERSNRTPVPAEDVGPEVDVSLSADPARRLPWRPRWPAARRRRPPWWEVPPQGYLEVESRNSPTSPRALRTLARAAVKAGLCWDPGNPLPVQRFVEAQERARLVFQARRELPRVTAVASQVMLVDSRLAKAEETLRQAVSHRSATAADAQVQAMHRPGTVGAEPIMGAGDPPRRQQPTDMDASLERAVRQPMLDRWSEAAILVVIAGGQAVLAYTGARDTRLGPVALGLLAMAAAVGSVVAAQLAARGIQQLGATAEGLDDPHRRRQLDMSVAGGALACGVALATTIGQLGSGAGPPVLGLALLGLATAASYAATPHGAVAINASRWRSVTNWLGRYQQERRSRRQLRAARAREAAAQAAVRQLGEELAVLVPQLFAAEQSALLFWRYQVAIGDATQRGFEQHLAAYSMRRSRGAWRPITDWWRGASPAPSKAEERFVSVGGEAPDWDDQVARVTMAAKRVLVRRGLLDITHGLRLPSLPGAPPFDHNGSGPAARSNPNPVSGDGHHRPVGRSAPDRDQPSGQS